MSVDMKIFFGLLCLGVIFIFLGGICVGFAYFHRDGNDRQKSHGPFGVFLIFLGLVLTLADVLTANAFMAAIFGIMLSIVVFHYGYTSIMNKKKEEEKESKKKKSTHGSTTPAA
ncbi:hypothetical protein D6855_09935 [Butyrivibrio sp. CB08]|nr:hypothetical protein D6855_09935 [Butyrivibrio sp. CB08]